MSTFQSMDYKDYGSVRDLLQDTTGEHHVRSISMLSWVQVAENRYVLMDEGGDYLTVEQVDESDFRVRHTAKLPFVPSNSKGTWKPLLRPREIAKGNSLLDAIHAADTYAGKHFIRRIVARNQAWRKHPATEGQLAFINKLRGPNDQLSASDIDKGRAGDMITKIKFGAKGRFDRIKATVRRNQRAEEKREEMEEMHRREVVRVGEIS